MNIKTQFTSYTKHFCVLLAVLFTANIWAQAGTSIFTYGKVDLRNAQGELSPLTRGAELRAGDAVLTGINGRAQLRMQDGAIFDLKPNSEFIIEEYVYQAANSLDDKTTIAKENKGFYRLMRGGFRAISGLIGKKNKKNYRVKTPVATIGIRGTDYTATLCETNCGSNGTGLYLSVGSGGVVLNNLAGSLDVDMGQSGFVSSPSAAPVLASNESSADAESTSTGDTVIAKSVIDENGNELAVESGVDLPEPVVEVPLPMTPGQVVVSVNGVTEQSSVGGANLITAGRDSLTEFTTVNNTYAQGTANISNQGFDANTGLFWGRWSNGTAVATNTAGSTDVDLSSSDAHWIYTTNQVTPVLPLTGKADFNLIGNTNPTDNMGNSGVLGSASLSADFTNQTVDADVNLSINDQTWDASATDAALNGEAATFSGDFDTVTITDQATATTVDGSGSLEGFITSDEAGDVSGAGLAYSLTDNSDTTVEGAAAFEVAPPTP